MAGLADFLMTAAPAAAAYDPMLTPEANALAGAKPVMQQPAAPATFQKPKGARNTIGVIADVLAVLGGQQPMYGSALRQQEKDFKAQQAEERAVQKQNVLGAYLADPSNPELQKQAFQLAPLETFEIVTKLTPKPASVSPSAELQLLDRLIAEGMPRDQAVQEILAIRRGKPQMLATERGYVPAAEAEGLAPFRAPPAPQQPRTQVVAVGDRQVLVDLNTGNPIRDLGAAPPKGGGTASTGGMNPQAVGKAKARMASIPAILQALDTLETMKPGMSGPLAGMIPGNLNADANSFDKVLGQLTQQIRGLTKIEGEGSISDLETRLMGLQLPSRTDTPQGRATAIRQLRALAKQTEASYRQMLGGGQPAPAAPAGGGFKVVGKRKP